MRVFITVAADIEVDGNPTPHPTDLQLQESASEAIEDAVKHFQGEGFRHTLENITGINIGAVQPFNTDAATSLWRCPECHREVRLTFAEMADIGNPICGSPECEDPDGEMELVTASPSPPMNPGSNPSPAAPVMIVTLVRGGVLQSVHASLPATLCHFDADVFEGNEHDDDGRTREEFDVALDAAQKGLHPVW